MPRTECLKDTVARVIPLWENTIAPAVRGGTRLLIAAHGNSLRALIKHLDAISDADIVGLNVPTRHTAGVRIGRRPEGAESLLSGRSGKGQGRDGCGGGPGEEEVAVV